MIRKSLYSLPFLPGNRSTGPTRTSVQDYTSVNRPAGKKRRPPRIFRPQKPPLPSARSGLPARAQDNIRMKEKAPQPDRSSEVPYFRRPPSSPIFFSSPQGSGRKKAGHRGDAEGKRKA